MCGAVGVAQLAWRATRSVWAERFAVRLTEGYRSMKETSARAASAMAPTASIARYVRCVSALRLFDGLVVETTGLTTDRLRQLGTMASDGRVSAHA